MQFQHGRKAIEQLGKPRFNSDFHFSSPRNLVLLCGTKGKSGTCHFAFDNHLVGLLYHPLMNKIQIHWFDVTYRTYSEANESDIRDVPADWNPYKRGLAFHTLQGLSMNPSDAQIEGDLKKMMKLSMANEQEKVRVTSRILRCNSFLTLNRRNSVNLPCLLVLIG